MKQVFFLFLSLVLCIFCSCSNSNIKNSDEKNQMEIGDTVATELVINGTNVWVRDKPKTGNVVAKLNSGDTCKIILKGDKDQVKCKLDFWYQIQIGDTIGWVYGSQTNITTNEIPQIIDYNEMLSLYFAKDSNLLDLVHTQIGYYCAENPGAACLAYKTFDDSKIKDIKDSDYIFSNQLPEPEGYFKTDYPEVKDGIYYKEIEIDKLPKLHTEMGGDYKLYPLPKNLSIQKNYYNIVITNGKFRCSFYMVLIDCKWYIIYLDLCQPGMA